MRVLQFQRQYQLGNGWEWYVKARQLCRMLTPTATYPRCTEIWMRRISWSLETIGAEPEPKNNRDTKRWVGLWFMFSKDLKGWNLKDLYMFVLKQNNQNRMLTVYDLMRYVRWQKVTFCWVGRGPSFWDTRFEDLDMQRLQLGHSDMVLTLLQCPCALSLQTTWELCHLLWENQKHVYILYIWYMIYTYLHAAYIHSGILYSINYQPQFHADILAGLWSLLTLDWPHGSMDTSLKINTLRLSVPKRGRVILAVQSVIDDDESCAEWMARYFALHGTGNDDQWQVQSFTQVFFFRG